MAEEAVTTPEKPEGGKQDPPEESGKTFTQDQVNDLIAREKGKIQRNYEGHDELKRKAARLDELEASNQSELEKAQTKIQRAEKRADDAEAKLLRYEVAQQKEVPAKLVPLLTASSREGLESQADLILENAKTEPAPEFDGGARDPAPEPDTPEMAHGKLITSVLTGEGVQANP